MASQGYTDKVSTFKIFVKNLVLGTTEQQLKAIFEEFGRVVECQLFRQTLAFIFMEDEVCGTHAITMLNGRTINGNVVGVEESKQTDQGPNIPTTRLRVKNIPSSLTARGLRDLFTKFGLVIAAEIANQEGILNIEATGDLRSARNEVNGFVYDGHALIVEPMIDSNISYSPKVRQPKPAENGRIPSLLPNPLAGRGRGRGRGRGVHPPSLFSEPFRQYPEIAFDGGGSNYKQAVEDFSPVFRGGRGRTTASSYFHEPFDDGFNPGFGGPPRDPNYFNEPVNDGFDPGFGGPPRDPNYFNEPVNDGFDPGFGGPPRDPNYFNEPVDDRFDSGFDDRYGPDPSQRFEAPNPWNAPKESEGRILREPYGPGLRHPTASRIRVQRPMFSQPMHANGHGLRGRAPPPRPLLPGPGPIRPLLPAPVHNRQPQPLLSGPIRNQQPQPLLPGTMQRPPFGLRQGFSQGPRTGAAIEPLFRRRHEILNGGGPPQPLMPQSNQSFYEDSFDESPFNNDQPSRVERIPIFRNNDDLLGRPRFQQPLKRFPPPFRGGPPVKRSVPEADPGEPFQAPAMIPFGTFQPPKKYFANRPKVPAKKKKKPDFRPEQPIPEQPIRPVPDFSMQTKHLPSGSILRPFPPPLMNHDFSQDADFC